MELFVQLVNLYFDEDVSRQINRAFAEEAVLVPIKFTACRTKFVLLRLHDAYSGVYKPQTDHDIYRAPELDREEHCCSGEEDIHGVRAYHEARCA